MAFWTYILRCADGGYFAGHNDDLDRQIPEHLATESEADGRPVALLWSQNFASREEAVAAEMQIKNWSREKVRALFQKDGETLSAAARKRLAEPFARSDVAADPASTCNERVETPVFVLVRPQLGENIGKAARAMLNFGLTEMRLVAPRDGWPNPSAGPAASGADLVLEQARVFGSVAEAVADCAHVYATTVRKRGVTKPVLSPEAASGEIHAQQGRSAILFGPERSGLETDDVAIARAIVTVPINPEFGSLNLAQAVILLAYEWSKGMDLASPPETDLDPPALQGEFEGMMMQLESMLDKAGFFHPPERMQSTKRTLRTMLTKPGWSSQEVRTMRGVLSALEGKKRRS